jgi:hypothetical protein
VARGFQRGHAKLGGRKAGSLNKTTVALREAILAAFHKTGGVDYLVWLSKEHPSAYTTLLGRVLPTEIEGSFKAQVDMTVPPEERRAIAQELFDRAFGLMGKSRPEPRLIGAEAIPGPK